MVLLLFVIHVLIALALIGVIMLQKSEGGALGMGGGGMSGFMTGRYEMVTEGGERFEIDIPTFSLDSPHTKRVLN